VLKTDVTGIGQIIFYDNTQVNNGRLVQSYFIRVLFSIEQKLGWMKGITEHEEPDLAQDLNQAGVVRDRRIATFQNEISNIK
jgi:hypothetical protein